MKNNKEKNKEEIKQEINDGLVLFFNKFEKNDKFTKIFLEILFENIIKNEKRL